MNMVWASSFCIFNFFHQCLIIFWVHRCFTSLVRFIPRYFILFEVIVNGIVFFLISLPISLLLAYKNATNFWILILYPATLLNSFISSSSFLMECLMFSMPCIMSSANKGSFTSFFPIQMPLISPSHLIAVAETIKTLKENIGSKISDIAHRNCWVDISPQARGTKEKIKK